MKHKICDVIRVLLVLLIFVIGLLVGLSIWFLILNGILSLINKPIVDPSTLLTMIGNATALDMCLVVITLVIVIKCYDD